MERLLQRIEHEVRGHRVRDLPADDPSCEDIDHERRVGNPSVVATYVKSDDKIRLAHVIVYSLSTLFLRAIIARRPRPSHLFFQIT